MAQFNEFTQQEQPETHLIIVIGWITIIVATHDTQLLLRRLSGTIDIRRMLLLLHHFKLKRKSF